MFDGTGWKTCQESIAIVKSGQNKSHEQGVVLHVLKERA